MNNSKEKGFFFSVRDENFRFITSCEIARAWGKQNRACICFTAAKIITMTICGVISNGLHFVSISLSDFRAKIIHSKWGKKYLFWSICDLDLWCPPRRSIKNWLICERSCFAGKVLCLSSHYKTKECRNYRSNLGLLCKYWTSLLLQRC